MQPAKTVVTLVHGTWATNAAWVESSSKLSSDLLARLPQPLVTNVFRWSGKNSASARNIAAANLAEELRKLIDHNPEAHHYVIGHSHGGNVALKAVGAAEQLHRVGVICLSTPFFHVGRRNLGTKREVATLQLGVGLGVATFWLYLFYLVFRDIDHLGPFPLYSGIPFFILVAYILGRWIKRADAVAEAFTVNVPRGTNLFIVRSTGDEAAMAISAFQFGGWMLTTLMRMYTKAVSVLHGFAESCQRYFISVRRPYVKILCALLSGLCAILLVALQPLGHIASTALAIALVLPMAFFVLFPILNLLDAVPLIGFACLTPLLLLIILFAAIPLGRDAALMAAFYEVTVESVPAGEWMVHQIVARDSQQLRHSSTYEDESALIAIRHWISSSCSEV